MNTVVDIIAWGCLGIGLIGVIYGVIGYILDNNK